MFTNGRMNHYGYKSQYKINEAYRYKVTHRVFFDLAIHGKGLGRITFVLFGELVLCTVFNFVMLSTYGIDGVFHGGSRFHKVIRGFLIQVLYESHFNFSEFGQLPATLPKFN